MSLVIFCLLFSSVDYVPVKGEIIWYLCLAEVGWRGGEKMQTTVIEQKFFLMLKKKELQLQKFG